LAEYRIFETNQFQKDLRVLSKAGHPKIVRKLQRLVYPQLRRYPHFGPNIRKLKNYSPDTWRFRIGAWRFFYEIDEDERLVLMVAASHRGSAY
jgi:mRNA interferase RelE/StbE